MERFAPDKIAVGDGATPEVREPQPSDTGLQNELLRKDVVTTELENGDRVYSMRIEKDELDGDRINEVGIFRGSLPIMIDAFVGKDKDGLTVFNFKMQEEI